MRRQIFLLCYLFQVVSLYNVCPESEHPSALIKRHISKAITYSRKVCSFNPFTVRLINDHAEFGEGDLKSCSWSRVIAQNAYPILLGNDKPLLSFLNPKERKTNAWKLNGLNLYSFFVILFINHHNIDKIEDKLRESVNPKLDFLFIVMDFPSSNAISAFELQKHLTVLKDIFHKIIFNVQEDTIWMKHPVQDHIVRVPHVPLAPSLNPRMGFNLPGKHFRVGISQAPPFCFQTPFPVPKSNLNVAFKGSFINIVKEASIKFNYTFEVTHFGFGYGKRLPNGTWTGKYSAIYYDTSGFDMVLLIPVHYLMQKGDFSGPINLLTFGFALGVPKTPGVPWYAFLEPYEASLWVVVICSFFLIGACQGLVIYIDKRLIDYNVFTAATFLPLSVAIEQDGFLFPRKLRGFVCVMMLSCMVLGTGYKSNLKSHLMFPKPDKIPMTFDELAHMSKFKITLALVGNIEQDFFLRSNLTIAKNLRSRILQEKNWFQCLKISLLEEKHVCFTWSIGKAMIAQRLTLNATIDPFLYSKGTAIQMYNTFGFHENSPYSQGFELIVMAIYEMGLMDKWEDELMFELRMSGGKKIEEEGIKDNSPVYKRLLEIANKADDNERKALKMSCLFAVFGIVIVGCFAAAAAFFIEKICRNFYSRIL